MLSVACDNGEFLTVLLQGVELVSVCCLELLSGDVGKLGFCNKGFGFGADKFLFEDDDLRGVWFLVFEVSDLVGDSSFALDVLEL